MTLRKHGNVGDPGILPRRIKSESSITRRTASRERKRERYKEGKLIKVGKRGKRKETMESRKEGGAGNDWHLGNCLVRTESNRGASNSTSSFLLAVCAYARKSVTKICSMIIYNGCALVAPSRMHAAVTLLFKGARGAYASLS